MKNLIYYPNFESRDLEWLKFALVYLENFSPIIPDTGEIFLSDLFKRLQRETDLLKKHKPEYEEGDRATRKAIKYVSDVLENPNSYANELNSANIVREWQNPEKQSYTLFQEKFIEEWKWFCMGHKLAQESIFGVQISKSLGELYMTFLAQEVAYEHEASPITDKNYLDKLSIAIRTKDVTNDNKILVAKNIIEHQLPLDFKNLTIEQVIKLRNKNGFSIKQRAFQNELNNMYEKVGKAIDPEKFIQDYKRTMKEWTLELAQYGVGIVATGISAYILLNNDMATDPEYLKQILEAGIVLLGGVSIVKNMNKNTDRKYCRQYLTELKKV
jgi:hypothetical protein